MDTTGSRFLANWPQPMYRNCSPQDLLPDCVQPKLTWPTSECTMYYKKGERSHHNTTDIWKNPYSEDYPMSRDLQQYRSLYDSPTDAIKPQLWPKRLFCQEYRCQSICSLYSENHKSPIQPLSATLSQCKIFESNQKMDYRPSWTLPYSPNGAKDHIKPPTSPQLLHCHDYTTVLSFIPWALYQMHCGYLLPIPHALNHQQQEHTHTLTDLLALAMQFLVWQRMIQLIYYSSSPHTQSTVPPWPTTSDKHLLWLP